MALDWYGKYDESNVYRHYPPFLRLFRLEFDSLLEDSFFSKKLLECLEKYLPPEKMHALRSYINDSYNGFDDVQKKRLFYALKNIKKEKKKFWKWFHNNLIQHVTHIAKDERLEFMLKNPPPTEQESFAIFFECPVILDCITDIFHIKFFLAAFEELNVPEYEEIIKKYVLPTLNNKPEDYQYSICELMRTLFYSKPGIVNEKEHSWYMDFVFTCTKRPHHATLLPTLDQQWRKKLEHYIVKLSTERREIKELNDEEYVTLEIEKSMKFRPPPNYFVDEESYNHVDDCNVSVLELRSYQRELAKDAREGDNAIICAPTGSGKTIVAVEIIRNHLITRNVDSTGIITSRSRVVFIVPTVPLVEQQQQVLQLYLGDKYSINGLSGADRAEVDKRTSKILDSHIVVVTPQLLVNLMSSVNVHKRLYVSDFTLFVLDECHHCGLNHPYEILMAKVRKFIEDNEKLHLGREIPQVVGLTASVGTEKTLYDPARTEHRILRLCVRMLATQLSTVRSHASIEELRQHVNLPIDNIHRVRRPPRDPFREFLCSIINQIVKILEPIINLIKKHVPTLAEFKFPKPTESVFRSAIERLIADKSSWPEELEDERLIIVTAVQDHLRTYLRAMNLNELVPSIFAYDFLTNEFNLLMKNKLEEGKDEFDQIYDDSVLHLEKIAQEDDGKHKEILTELKNIISGEYKRNPETRTLIFCETRALTLYLATYLNKWNEDREKKDKIDEDQLACYLTSTNQSRKLGGMSSSEQKAIIQSFSLGQIKILVVTSVAEEGLDISACNLIIKYNTVGSERTMIQRRGRARSKNSKAMLICLDDDVEQREVANMVRETIMHKCLENLQSKSKNQLHKLIEEMRRTVRLEEQQLEDEKDKRIRALEDKAYELQCAKCYHRICDSSQIRSVLDSHYCCVQPSIWKYVKIGSSNEPSIDQHFTQCAPFKCFNCGETIGTVILFAEVFLPSIKHSAIVLKPKMGLTHSRPEDAKRIEKQKWIDIQKNFFLVEQISLEALASMESSLRQANQDDYEQMRLQAEHAVQRQIEKLKEKRMRKNRSNFMAFNNY